MAIVAVAAAWNSDRKSTTIIIYKETNRKILVKKGKLFSLLHFSDKNKNDFLIVWVACNFFVEIQEKIKRIDKEESEGGECVLICYLPPPPSPSFNISSDSMLRVASKPSNKASYCVLIHSAH